MRCVRVGVDTVPMASSPDGTHARDAVHAALAKVGVGEPLWKRLVAVEPDWERLQHWLTSTAKWGTDDVAALCSLHTMGLDDDEVEDWVLLGPLSVGLRLVLVGISPEQVRRFPLDAKHGSGAFLKMMQASTGTGIHIDDLLWWHTAGVMSLKPPYLHKTLWPQWRSVGATRLGMRRAALAAAAGLSPEVAITLASSGEFDAESLSMLAALRAGQTI